MDRVGSTLAPIFCPGFDVPHAKIAVEDIARRSQYYLQSQSFIPICSMYGIFTNIYLINDPNVGKYTTHGAYGIIFILIISCKIL